MDSYSFSTFQLYSNILMMLLMLHMYLLRSSLSLESEDDLDENTTRPKPPKVGF